MTEINQKEPLDLDALHTLYSGCTPQEKCELIERIWKLEGVVREYRKDHGADCDEKESGAFGTTFDDRCSTCKAADDILKGRPHGRDNA